MTTNARARNTPRGEGIRLLLVYPPISRMERYGSRLGVFGGKQIPLGIYHLAAYVRREGFAVQAVDAEALGLTAGTVVERLREMRADVLGISVTTVAFRRGLELARRVKRELPGVVTVMGGPHVSCMPAQPLGFSAVDFAVPREGEKPLTDLLGALERGENPRSVRGLVHRENGEIVQNPPGDTVADLDALPLPAYDLIPDMALYTPPPFNYLRRPVANIITSRGCPNDCTFCENATFGKRARLRGAERVVDEIEWLVRERGVREIAFVDDTFTLSRRRIYRIFEEARRRGLIFPWTCMSRINTVDAELLEFMRDRGCWYIAFGIESGDAEILETIRKRIDLGDVRRVVGCCSRLGIRTKGFFMVGHPGETLASIDRTIALALDLPLDHVVVTINTPMPGSHQYRHIREYGEVDETSWSRFNYWCPVFVPYGLTREALLRKQREFLRRFYCRPAFVFRGAARCLRHPKRTLRQCRDLAADLVDFHPTRARSG